MSSSLTPWRRASRGSPHRISVLRKKQDDGLVRLQFGQYRRSVGSESSAGAIMGRQATRPDVASPIGPGGCPRRIKPARRRPLRPRRRERLPRPPGRRLHALRWPSPPAQGSASRLPPRSSPPLPTSSGSSCDIAAHSLVAGSTGGSPAVVAARFAAWAMSTPPLRARHHGGAGRRDHASPSQITPRVVQTASAARPSRLPRRRSGACQSSWRLRPRRGDRDGYGR